MPSFMWCDIKLRAFEGAHHKSYVYLKVGYLLVAFALQQFFLIDIWCAQDKWEILVHIATISPQQRKWQSMP